MRSASGAQACAGVILAGGRSRRFGGAPKGLMPVDGEPIVLRVGRALAAACDDLLVIANDPAIADAVRGLLPRVRVAKDVYRDAGPLAGIHAALVDGDAAALVCAWDMPHVVGPLFVRLRTEGEKRGRVCAPARPGSAHQGEPLCAFYPASALAPCTALLERGERRAAALLDAVPTYILPVREVAELGPPERLLSNINDPASLAAVVAR